MEKWFGLRNQNYIRDLITLVTKFKATEDAENFQICEKYVTSVLLYHRFLDVLAVDVWVTAKQIHERFKHHSEHRKAKAWESLTSKLKECSETDKYNSTIPSVLYVLMKLSHLRTNLPAEKSFNYIVKSTESKEHCSVDLTGNEEERMYEYAPFNDESEEGSSNSSDNEEPDNQIFSDPVSSDSGVDISPNVELDLSNLQEEVDSASAQSDWFKSQIIQPYWNHQCFIASSCANIKKNAAVTEHVFMTELIWVLHGHTSSFLFPWNGKHFYLREGTHLVDITQDTLTSTSEPILQCATSIVHLKEFCKKNSQPNKFKVLEAFALSLWKSLRVVKEHIINLEKILIDQDETFTLLMMLDNLRPLLNHVQLLWDVLESGILHQPVGAELLTCVQNIHLLYSIYEKLQAHDFIYGRDNQHFSILLSIFLDTCKPYLEFAEHLLKQGQLEDEHHEFFIERVISNNPSDTAKEVLLLSEVPTKYKFFLYKVLSETFTCAKLVVTLRELHNWKPFQEENHDSLWKLFGSESRKKLNKGEPERTNTITPIFQKEVKMSDDSIVISPSIIDPFLKANFKKIYPSLSTIEINSQAVVPVTTHKKIGETSSGNDLPLNVILEETLISLVSKLCHVINMKAMDTLKDDLCFQKHFLNIRKYFLLEDGRNMTQLVSSVLKKILKGKFSQSAALICSTFKTIITEELFSRNSERVSLSLREELILNDKEKLVDDLDALCLTYSAPAPINIILNAESITIYQKVFRFLMKLSCAKSAIENLQFIDFHGLLENKEECQKQEHTLYLMRMNLMYFINNLYQHFMNGILHDKQVPFLAALSKAENFHSVHSLHHSYLEELQFFCLLSSSHIFFHKQICRLLNILVCFARNWNRRTLISGMSKMESLEQEFVTLVWGISRSLSLYRKSISPGDQAMKQFIELGTLYTVFAVQSCQQRHRQPAFALFQEH